MKNRIATLIIALLLLTGFTTSLQAQTLDETVAYLKNTGHAWSSIQGSSSEGYYILSITQIFEKVSNKKIFFIEYVSTTPKNKRSSNKEMLENSDTRVDRIETYSADLDKVNFSINKGDKINYLKMFSNMNQKSISVWNDRMEGTDSADDPQTSYTIGLENRTEKECAGILKALKHLQKILGCENGAIDIQEKVKNMFEE